MILTIIDSIFSTHCIGLSLILDNLLASMLVKTYAIELTSVWCLVTDDGAGGPPP